MKLHPGWEYVSDRVMGGVSDGALSLEQVAGQPAARLSGRVSLENNGGFIQMAFDLNQDQDGIDASEWLGLSFTLRGNGESYDIRLRTAQLSRPWQSFRTKVATEPSWETVQLPFSAFQPHRTDEVFSAAGLRRIGVLAIGRAFDADITVAGVGFYR